MAKIRQRTPPTTNTAPENQWLEDDISLWNATFLGTFVHFQAGGGS